MYLCIYLIGMMYWYCFIVKYQDSKIQSYGLVSLASFNKSRSGFAQLIIQNKYIFMLGIGLGYSLKLVVNHQLLVSTLVAGDKKLSNSLKFGVLKY